MNYIIIDTETPDEANTRISSISIHTFASAEKCAEQLVEWDVK